MPFLSLAVAARVAATMYAQQQWVAVWLTGRHTFSHPRLTHLKTAGVESAA